MHMGHRNHGCGPRGRFEFQVPAALFAMRGARRGSWGPFHFDFDEGSGWGGGRSGGRGGRRRMFDGGELQLLLLFLIADKGKARHGYDLIRSIEELTGGAYAPSPGVVYPTLTLLQDMGFIEESAAEGTRKAYQVTAEGKAHIEENAEEVAELFERLTSLGDERRANPGPVLGRAVKNVMTALKHRVSRDGF